MKEWLTFVKEKIEKKIQENVVCWTTTPKKVRKSLSTFFH